MTVGRQVKTSRDTSPPITTHDTYVAGLAPKLASHGYSVPETTRIRLTSDLTSGQWLRNQLANLGQKRPALS
jgi:hypothetical protein